MLKAVLLNWGEVCSRSFEHWSPCLGTTVGPEATGSPGNGLPLAQISWGCLWRRSELIYAKYLALCQVFGKHLANDSHYTITSHGIMQTFPLSFRKKESQGRWENQQRSPAGWGLITVQNLGFPLPRRGTLCQVLLRILLQDVALLLNPERRRVNAVFPFIIIILLVSSNSESHTCQFRECLPAKYGFPSSRRKEEGFWEKKN